MTNQDKYRQLCDVEAGIPFFSRAWWLDATTGVSGWDVVMVYKGGSVIATMPYVLKKKYFFRVLSQPALTQTLGPWFASSSSKYHKQLATQKDAMYSMIQQLPKFDIFMQSWNYLQQNWLPFYWKGFSQSTYYTYTLPLEDINSLWFSMQENIRSDINKAKARYGLVVRDDLSAEDFLRLNNMTFLRQKKIKPYTDDFVKKLDSVCESKQCRKIFIAVDQEDRQHAGVYIVWDKNSAYYLMGGADPELRNSGATSLCLWEAINFSATVSKQFDFEGSMIESVERFVRGFGAIQTPYFNVTKVNSRILNFIIFLKDKVCL